MTVRALPGVLAAALAVAGLPDPGAGQALKDDPRVVEALELLERWGDAQQAYQRLPGVSMAVVHDQELLWARGFGHAHVEAGTAATPSTLYSICSISKLFTSIGVLQLRDRGRVGLDDPVAHHLRWFEITGAHESSPVTLRGILTHSAGLPRESDHPYWTGPDYPFPPREAVVARVREQEMLYSPSTYYQYSNLGLTLAGEVVAAVSGQPFDAYVRTHILEPLGLEDTHPDHLDRFRGGRLATGYSAQRRHGSREAVPAYQVRGIAPAAGFISTVEDLARFASWQFRVLDESDAAADGTASGDRAGGSRSSGAAPGPAGPEVLSRNTLREMHRVHWVDPDWSTHWGLGFAVWRSGDETFVGHGGYCPGYQSHLLLHAGKKVAAVFMTNTNGVNSGNFTRRAYEIVAPAVASALEDPEGAAAPDPELARYVGRYDSWLAGETHAIVRDGAMALVSFPTDDPLRGLTKLRQVGEHTFRRVRDDGALGEEIRFEVGPDGEVTRLWRNSNYLERVR